MNVFGCSRRSIARWVAAAAFALAAAAFAAWWICVRSIMPATMPDGFALSYDRSGGMLDDSASYRLAVGASSARLRKDGTERTYAFDVSEAELRQLYGALRAERLLDVVQFEGGTIHDAAERSLTLSWGGFEETVVDGGIVQVASFDRERFDGAAGAVEALVAEKIASDRKEP